jgi:uncharacterized protein (DUF736 family)
MSDQKYETKNNSGALFKNDRKEKDTHPDYKGNAVIDGVDMWVSAWLKTAQSGTKYMSLSFQPKNEAAEPRRATETTGPHDDEIPF